MNLFFIIFGVGSILFSFIYVKNNEKIVRETEDRTKKIVRETEDRTKETVEEHKSAKEFAESLTLVKCEEAKDWQNLAFNAIQKLKVRESMEYRGKFHKVTQKYYAK